MFSFFSATALPVTLRCVEEKLHVDEKISLFVLPMGSNINVSGSALYDAIAAMFLAQLNGINVSFWDMILLK